MGDWINSAECASATHRKLVELERSHAGVCDSCRNGVGCVIADVYPRIVASAAVLAAAAEIIEGGA